MKHLPVNNKLFTENRKRFVKALKPNSIAISTATTKCWRMETRCINSFKIPICTGFRALSRKIP